MNTQEAEPIIKLSEKIDSLTVTIQDGFTRLNDRLDNVESRLCKVEEGMLVLDRRLISVEDRLHKVEDNLLNADKRLIVVETNTTAMERMGTVENKLPDISEKFGELKNWRQISFVIIAAIAGWFVRGGKF
jgi:hypothetical protein